MERTVIFTPDAPWSPGGSSQAIAHDGVLYVSGQLPIDPTSGQMPPRPFNPLFGGGEQAVDAQTRQCLTNVNAICRAAGADLSDAIKLTVYTPVLIEFASVIDRVFREFFPVAAPARSMIGVNVLQGNALVQVDAIVPLG
ncbi:RidA family protein [Herbiconiux sp. YIM B11900]|uniref:RidA family protein n=1 Tax=Herbiconiux sp. YIM B11900 TaxID=3404131 RepID=UPI003F86DEE1